MKKPWRVLTRSGGAHPCKLPGAWRRAREGLHYGAVIRCLECRQVWIFMPTPDFGIWQRAP